MTGGGGGGGQLLQRDIELEGVLQEEEDADQALLKALGGAIVFCSAMAGNHNKPSFFDAFFGEYPASGSGRKS
jgi:hypothetical protein